MTVKTSSQIDLELANPSLCEYHSPTTDVYEVCSYNGFNMLFRRNAFPFSLQDYWNVNAGSPFSMVVWDAFKASIRGLCITLISAIKSEQMLLTYTVQSKLADVSTQYSSSPTTDRFYSLSWEQHLHMAKVTRLDK